MKAGNGIIHDETINVDSTSGTNRIHGFQFWINLPAKNKAEQPEYMAIESPEIPQKIFPDERGWIKVIAGDYQELHSKIPNYSAQFLYHIHLHPGKSFTLFMEEKVEVAVFLPTQDIILNDAPFGAGEFVEFDRNAGEIAIQNNLQKAADILLFGGEPYTEPIVAEGPFIMNSQAEIAEAYRDYFAGKYGEIHPQKSSV
jgi:redox-sensitive bicupin YhaK (pirin superfamily)